MIDLAWGGYTNGQLPDSAFTVIDDRGHRLEHVAAAKFLAMRDACHAATGFWIEAQEDWGINSCYRDLGNQVYAKQEELAGKGSTAATPGTSNHGWGRAIDITGFENNPAVWNWLLEHAAEYGFSWQTGEASGERWHWESFNTPSATPIESDIMTPEQESKLNFIYDAILTGGKSMPDHGKSIGESLAEINAAVNQKVSRTVNGKNILNSQIQDNADTNTMVRTLLGEHATATPASAAVVDYDRLAATIVAKLPATTLTKQDIADAFHSLVLKAS